MVELTFHAEIEYFPDVESSRVERESDQREEFLQTVEKLQMELQARTEQYQAQVNDNQQLSRWVVEINMHLIQ